MRLPPLSCNRKSKIQNLKFSTAFSLVELLIVIAIIAIMASIVISAFSNASADSRGVLVRQQQAVMQESLNAWIAHESSPAGSGSLKTARDAYDAATTGALKLALIAPYLSEDPSGGPQFTPGPVTDAFQTSTMATTGQYVTFSTWEDGSYPKIVLNP